MSFHSPEAFRVYFFHSFGGNVAIKASGKSMEYPTKYLISTELNLYWMHGIHSSGWNPYSLVFSLFRLNRVSEINVRFGWTLWLFLSVFFSFHSEFENFSFFVFSSWISCYRLPKIPAMHWKMVESRTFDNLKMHQRRANSDNQMKRY